MRSIRFMDREVSVLALGTSEFGGNCPESKGREFMDAYVSLGGNLIDTARVYGDFVTPRNGESEKVIGRWMSERKNRDSLFLSTKGAHPELSTMHIGRLSREEIHGDISESLENLQTDHVDVYFLHRDDINRSVGEIMETLNGLVEEGMTRRIGVSNWSAARIEEAQSYAAAHGLCPIHANQIQFSLARQMNVEDPTLVRMEREDWEMHNRTGMICMAFSSQAKGFFTKLDTLGENGLPDKARRRYLSPENLAIYNRILEVQKQTGASVGAIALAWLTCQPFPVIPLIGASRVEHVTAMQEAAELILTPEQVRYISEV